MTEAQEQVAEKQGTGERGNRSQPERCPWHDPLIEWQHLPPIKGLQAHLSDEHAERPEAEKEAALRPNLAEIIAC